MRFISRSEMGWPATASRVQPETPRGVKVHYEGGVEVHEEHSQCIGHWTEIREMHLANREENYSDVAYNLAVCSHGYVLEGRGAGHQTGANGNQTLNRQHYAVCALIGGSQAPSADLVAALKEAIQYLRDHGAGSEIKGHRDGYATSCPGEPLYALVTSGALEPGGDSDPSPAYEPFPGSGFFTMGRKSPIIKAMRDRLIAEGCNRYQSSSDQDVFGSGDKNSYAAWQRKLGYSGSDADGIPGSTSWGKLKVPNV